MSSGNDTLIVTSSSLHHWAKQALLWLGAFGQLLEVTNACVTPPSGGWFVFSDCHCNVPFSLSLRCLSESPFDI
jgi:hypothetical protein